MLDTGNFKGPALLKADLDSGKWLVIVARNSGEGGEGARGFAADELFKTAAGLRDVVGIDILAHLPSKESVIDGLRKATSVRSQDSEGGFFVNEYLVLTLSSINTILFISTGSGKKLDGEFDQPFLQELISLAKIKKPALVFSNRIDRIFRHFLSAAELLKVLQLTNGTLGDCINGLRGNDPMSQFMTLFEVSGSEKEAAQVPKKTREGMKVKTDLLMQGGACRYAVMNIPPAGTIRMTLKNDKGATGSKMLYLDDPQCFPSSLDVTTGFPTPSHSSKPSNVALVQWALSHLGKPGHTHTTVGAYLVDQGFSSPGMRQTNGVDACFTLDGQPDDKVRPIRSILFNLEFYETGILKIQLGVDDLADFEISGCFPLSGKWADATDFARIKAYLNETTGGGPALLALVGVLVQTEDGLRKLVKADYLEGEEPSYKLFRVEKEKNQIPLTNLPHEVLAESIIQGLIKASETIWIPTQSEIDTVNPALQSEIAKVRKNIGRIERRAEGMINQINEFDDLGAPLLDPATRRRIGLDRTTLIEKELEPETQKLQDLENNLFIEMEKHAQKTEAAPINELTKLISSLRDSSDTTYNQMWKTSLSIHTLTRTRFHRRGHSLYTVIWEGTFKISALSRSFEIPFSGSHAYGIGTKIEERISTAIELMSNGVPMEGNSIRQWLDIKSLVAERLGIPTNRFNLGTCLDPRILEIAMFILNNPEMNDLSIAENFNEKGLLIARIRESFSRQPFGCRWIGSASTMKRHWFHIAGQNQGRVTQIDLLKIGSSNWIQNLCRMRQSVLKTDSWLPSGQMSSQLAPCEHCGSFRRSTSRLFEPVGMVCLDCHLDEAGLLWPSDPYDQWLHVAGM